MQKLVQEDENMLRNAKGMTLLEIMIVLAILGGLIGILGTQVVGNLKKANIKEAKIQISEISKLLEMYYTDCGSYPTSDAGLEALVDASAASNCSSWGPDPYMKKVPLDPWKNDFIYESNGGKYRIISLGSDREEGGDGDAADISSDDI